MKSSNSPASYSRQLLLENCNRILLLEHGKVKMDEHSKEVADAYFG